MNAARHRVPPPSSTGPSQAGRFAWYAMLACMAVLPLVMAVDGARPGNPIPLTDDVYHIPKLLTLALLLFAATVPWALDILVAKTPVRLGVVQGGLGAFAAAVAISTATGIEPVSSLFGVSGLYTGAITWFASIWFAFLVSQYSVSTQNLRQASWSVVSGATVAAAIGLLQTLGADPLRTPLTEMNAWMVARGLSTLGNPNYAALYYVVPAVVALGLAASSRTSRLKYTAALCALVLTAGTFVTLTRAAWIGVVIGLGILILIVPGLPGTPRHRALALGAVVATVALLGTLVVGLPTLTQRVVIADRTVDAFSSGRLTMWTDTLRTIANRPWLGTGADRMALGAYEVQTKVVAEGANRYVIQDPHSLPLLLAGSFGIPALLALALYAVRVPVSGARLLRNQASASEKTTLYAAWTWGTVGFLVTSLLTVYTVTGVFMLFLALGIVSSPLLKPVRIAWAAPVFSVLALTLVATIVFGAVQGFRSSYHHALAARQDPQANLEEAIRLAPWDTRVRVTYLFRKIKAYEQIIAGQDVAAAKDALETLDTEVRLEIARSPRELLWYRLRIDMYQLAKGHPAYDPRAVKDALDFALAAFPDDPEFTEWQRRAEAGTF